MTENAAATPPFPQARWKLERSGEGIRLTIWAGPDTGRYTVYPVTFPMEEGEAWAMVRGFDRVMSWAAQSASGMLTAPASNPLPAPEEVAQQLDVRGYVVTTHDLAAHTALVKETPWANWVEEVPPPEVGHISWFVDVFAGDDADFCNAAQAAGAVLVPSVYTGEAGD